MKRTREKEIAYDIGIVVKKKKEEKILHVRPYVLYAFPNPMLFDGYSLTTVQLQERGEELQEKRSIGEGHAHQRNLSTVPLGDIRAFFTYLAAVETAKESVLPLAHGKTMLVHEVRCVVLRRHVGDGMQCKRAQ